MSEAGRDGSRNVRILRETPLREVLREVRPEACCSVVVVCSGTDTCNKIVASWPARPTQPDSSITLSVRRVNQSSFSEVQGARRVNNGARDGGG